MKALALERPRTILDYYSKTKYVRNCDRKAAKRLRIAEKKQARTWLHRQLIKELKDCI